jgi:hypothetical protein
VFAGVVLGAGGLAAWLLGEDREPIVCPNGEPLRIDVDAPIPEPSLADGREAQRKLPDGKLAVFNAYTGEFEAVQGGDVKVGGGTASVPEPLVYGCGPQQRTDARAFVRGRS